ncbi:hypothetical protein [Vibrio sp. F74]|uniref:hypothetical protein n=1 Tax=Vibrio sp. F74 TaxID=700020 RepID=UPI0035F5F3B4
MPLEQIKMLGYRYDSPKVLCMVGNATPEILSELKPEFKIGDWFLSEAIETIFGHHVQIYGPYTEMNEALQDAHKRFGVTSFRDSLSELTYT